MSEKSQLPHDLLLEAPNLVKTSDLSTKFINIRKASFEQITVPEHEAKKKVQDGWEIVPSRLTKSTKLQKEKPHDVAFQDRVWGLFAKMGFNYLNNEPEFTLSYGDGLTKKNPCNCLRP